MRRCFSPEDTACLTPKAKQTLTYTIDGDWDYSGATGVWSSFHACPYFFQFPVTNRLGMPTASSSLDIVFA